MVSSLTVVNCPSQDLAITNKVFASPETVQRVGSGYVEVSGLVYKVEGHPSIAEGCLALNTVQRRNLRVSSGDVLDVARVDWRGVRAVAPQAFRRLSSTAAQCSRRRSTAAIWAFTGTLRHGMKMEA